MRINRKILLQMAIAGAFGAGVVYLQRQISGPGNALILGLLGFAIAWLVIPAVADDILRVRRWLSHRSISRLSAR
jgi:hypothetical protein